MHQGCTYATLSPVFASPSKPGYGPPLGPGVFALPVDAMVEVEDAEGGHLSNGVKVANNRSTNSG